MSDAITQLSIKALLNSGVDYVIPMYQRNYAWDEGEITQLIQDIIDYLPAEQDYYIGTLVVFERKESKPPMFETIDGQPPPEAPETAHYNGFVLLEPGESRPPAAPSPCSCHCWCESTSPSGASSKRRIISASC